MKMTDSLVGPLVGATVAMICLTTLVISIRIGVRTRLRTFGIDDVLITASWFFTIAMCTSTLISAHAGFGRHHQDVSLASYERFLKLTIATSATYSYGLALAKMSFAVLYIRILPDRHLVIINKSIIMFLCCQAVEESLIPIFQCRPIAKAWTVGVRGQCLDLPVLWWCGFGFNLCTDLILFIQPIPTLWKLQLPLIKRLGLIAMLSLGLMVCAISVIRMHAVTEMGVDDTYDLAIPIIWSEAEVSTLILCSCVPSLRKMVQRLPWFSRAFGVSSVDSQQPAIETIGQLRKNTPYESKDSNRPKGVGQQSGLTGTTLTYPMSVLCRPAKGSHVVNDEMEAMVRTPSAMSATMQNQLDPGRDLEASAETISTPTQRDFPLNDSNETGAASHKEPRYFN